MIKYLKHVASRRDCILYDGKRHSGRGHGEWLIWLNKAKDERITDTLGLCLWTWCRTLEQEWALELLLWICF